MSLKFISITLFFIQLLIFLSWFYIPFRNFNFKFLNTNKIIDIFKVRKFSKFTFITNFIILIYMLFFIIVSFFDKLLPSFTFLYPFVFMLAIVLTLLFYCADYHLNNNIFNSKFSKSLLIDECICHLIHLVSTILVILVLVAFKMNNLIFYTNNKIYLVSTVFIIYYILKLCSHFKNHGNFNYKIIDKIYNKYGKIGVNIFSIILTIFILFITKIGVKVIN